MFMHRKNQFYKDVHFFILIGYFNTILIKFSMGFPLGSDILIADLFGYAETTKP